jgi:tetratricopeptide (TPR) repeat protein
MPTGRFSKLDFNSGGGDSQSSTEDAWPDLDDVECMKIGNRYLFSGEYETALSAYSRALRFNKNLVQGWIGQVECLIEMGEYPEAGLWCDRGLERFRNDPDLLALKGFALAKSGDLSRGLEFVDGAVNLRSPSPKVWIVRGRVMMMNKDTHASANHCFQKALELATDQWETEFLVGRAYNRAQLFANAEPPLRMSLRKAGQIVPVLLEMGICLEGLGKVEEAEGYLRKAIAINPDHAPSHAVLDWVLNTGPVTKMWRKFTVKRK